MRSIAFRLAESDSAEPLHGGRIVEKMRLATSTGRCRLHGGLSPGAPRGQRNGNFKTGKWSIEALEERKWLRSLVRSFAKPASVK